MIRLNRTETGSIPEDKSNRINRAASKIGRYVKENTLEVVAGTSLTVVCLGLAAVGLKFGSDQDEGIDRSLDREAAQLIPGAVDVDVDGTMWNYNEGSLHGATVELTDGTECSIQFTTFADKGFMAGFSPDNAKIVSFGTCPTVEE